MNNLKNQKVIESDITSINTSINNINTLIGGGGLSTVSNTLIGAINEIHDGYLPLTGGTMTGPIKFKSPGFELDWTNDGEDIILQLKGAESFGSRYFKGEPDIWTFSASGNANNKTGADFAIKGDGTCQIRGSNIVTETTIKKMNSTAPKIFLLPYLHYSSLPSKSTDSSVYFKEYLQYLVKNYSSLGNVTTSTIFMGIAHPNSVGNMIINIYSIGNYNSTGLPQYSSGLYIPLTGNPGSLAHFGTNNGTFHYTGIS